VIYWPQSKDADSELLEFVMDLKKTFGKVFARTRKKAGLVQDDFEPTTSRSYISYIERGEVSVTMDKLNDVSEILGTHPVSLVFQTYLAYDQNISALDLMAIIMDDLKKLDT
jgi:transcriptional regulator with XRE-family HTH domain